MSHQVLYGGVRLLGEGPSMRNVARLDAGCLPMVHAMAIRGMQIDPTHLERMDIVLTQDMERLTEEVKDIAGYYVNLGSGDQVSKLLFKDLGLIQARPKLTKSETRESVENEVLVAIQHDHPVVARILEYKEVEKLRGTYARPIPKLAKRTAHGIWRMFPNFTTTRIPSGRFAVKEPNLLAMPNRTERGRELLNGFITDPGWTLLSVDECLHPDTMVETLLGPRRMRDIDKGDKLLSYSDHKITWGTVIASKSMKPKRAYRITFDSGEFVIASFDHKWPTQWAFAYPGKPEIVIRQTHELRVGERMVPCRESISAGYKTWYADGGVTNYSHQHRVVAEAFLGPCPPSNHVHHIDGDQLNNNPSNLEYKTPSRHRSDHSRGEKHPQARLKDRDYALIRELVESGTPRRSIAILFGISRNYVAEILRGNKGAVNHRIVAIEYLGVQSMWGITVDPHHNYVLSCGVVTQNSQIEPRTVAHRSQDRALMNIYWNEEDIYSDFATSAFRLEDKRYKDERGKWIYPSVNSKKHRFPAKTCILASIYRVTNTGLLEQMPTICKHCYVESAKHNPEHCPRFEALWNEDNCQDLINAFYMSYPGISKMQRMDDARARKSTMVWDDWGRMMHTTAVRSVHEWVVSAALREAGNMPIQGFACGTLKLTMAAVQDDLVAARMYGDVWYPLLPVHDEILSECRADVAEEIGAHIAERFRTCVELTVPLKAEYAMADAWGSIIK